MGLALAAELNGHPGPMHVLELGDSLDLSDQQRAKMQELFTSMRAEAIPLGERLIAQQADLDKEFAKTITRRAWRPLRTRSASRMQRSGRRISNTTCQPSRC
jgi:hypothetical protein